MKVRVLRQRGGPIYISSGGRTISLVPEAILRIIAFSWSRHELHLLSPSALFVIDDRGVERLRFTPDGGTLAALLASLAPGPLTYWWQSSSGGKLPKAGRDSLVANVFGELHQKGDTTIIPVVRAHTWVRAAGAVNEDRQPTFYRVSPIGIVEVDPAGVRIKARASSLTPALGIALICAWSLYWTFRRSKEWAGRS
jgi:hypothetical protein